MSDKTKTFGLDFDLEFLLENERVIKMIADQNNMTPEELRSIFENAIKNGITTLRQYNAIAKQTNEH